MNTMMHYIFNHADITIVTTIKSYEKHIEIKNPNPPLEI